MREFYLADNHDYGEKVVRVQDVESLPCWYGYIYTENNSEHRLKETLRPEFEGITVFYPFLERPEEGTPLEVHLDIAKGTNDIVILRRVRAEARMTLNYLTHEPELTRDQLLNKANNMGERTDFKNTQAFFKLL